VGCIVIGFIRRRLLGWLAPLIVVCACCLPTVHAQAPPSAGSGSAEADSGKTPAFQYTVAFLSIIIVMVIVCAPSRKR
jgi:hypothetical protein